MTTDKRVAEALWFLRNEGAHEFAKQLDLAVTELRQSLSAAEARVKAMREALKEIATSEMLWNGGVRRHSYDEVTAFAAQLKAMAAEAARASD